MSKAEMLNFLIESYQEELENLNAFPKSKTTKQLIELNNFKLKILQEKAEREKGCEYCNNHKPLLSLCTEYAIEIDDKEISIWQDLKCLEIFNINLCPMCGRKLVEE